MQRARCALKSVSPEWLLRTSVLRATLDWWSLRRLVRIWYFLYVSGAVALPKLFERKFALYMHSLSQAGHLGAQEQVANVHHVGRLHGLKLRRKPIEFV